MKKAVDILSLSVDVLILAGTISFLIAIIQKIFFLGGYATRFMPTAFFKFSVNSLLLGIALSVRKSGNK